MDNLTQYWTLPASEQHTIQAQTKPQEPVLPAQYTLDAALDTDAELAMCASGLFIMVVQNRDELGGGYGLQVLALGKYVQRHFETKEAVEAYLEAKCPYKQGAAVWVPLANYRSCMDETEILSKFRKESEYERAQEA